MGVTCAYCGLPAAVSKRCTGCGAYVTAKYSQDVSVKVPPPLYDMLINLRECDRRLVTVQDNKLGRVHLAFMWRNKAYYFEVDDD